MSNINDLFVSYKVVDTPTITVPKFDDIVATNNMLANADLKTKVENVKSKLAESPVFQGWKMSQSTDTTYDTDKQTTTNTSSSNMTAKDLIKKEEGFRSTRYKDAGSTSIGYGFYGTTYWKGNSITKEEADKVLDGIIDKQSKILSKYPIWDKLNENQKAALHSYMYNVGPGKFAENTQMGKALASGDLQKIHDAINITTSQGKRLEVLVKRRNTEKQLFNS